MGVGRRAVVLAAATLACGAAASTAHADGGDRALGSLGKPSRDVQPKFRWWWPHGLVDHAEIRREVDQIADAGFGGVEIADVHHSATEELDPAGHGWGTPAWVRAIETALRRANERGVVVDMTIGPSWPAAVPSITPDSAGAIKELAYGAAVVEGDQTHSGPVPGPRLAASEAVKRQDLVRVQVARVAAGSDPERLPVTLDQPTVQDVTAQVQDGRITWTAPDDGRWMLISYWLRGSGQRPERGPHSEPLSYVVDHFSSAGTRAVIDFWETHILTRDVRRELRRSGGAFFEDSIEMETDATLWTPSLPDEFERRMGYSPIPYLPVLLEHDEDEVFNFDAATSRYARRDFWEVMSQLYIERHLLPLRNWAHALGMKLRIQPYGLETDAIAKAALVDIPEGENLGFRNLDDFRSLAGGRDMGGRLILSNEAGATQRGSAYSVAWDATLRTLAAQYAAGVNQAVLHGFSYADAPGARWPGFAAFTPYDGGAGYGESWGPRTPTWEHVPDVSGYLARTQEILQRGVNKVDAAQVRQKGFAGSGFSAPWLASDGVPVGWSHSIISPRLLHLPSAQVTSGRLAIDGPGYKALVLEGDAFSPGRERVLQIDTAEKLLEFARDGLRIVIVGPSWLDARVPGIAQPGDNERLRGLMAELLAQPTVRRVDDRPQIGAALADLGVRRDVEYAVRSPLLHSHRADDRTDYYYLANGSPSARVDHDVTFAARGRGAEPYRIDAWTGAIEPIALYERDGDRIRTRVTLTPGETTIVAIPRGRGGDRTHATATEADAVRYSGHKLVARDTQAGTYATTLSNGRTVQSTIDAVPAPVDLSTWTLEVEDWRPGATATRTERFRSVVALDGLRPWSQIPGLEDASGVGRYTARIALPRGWDGAYLELGEVLDTYRVEVNGRRLGPSDQVNPVVDLGRRLERGLNTIEIEVATTLRNRLRVADAAVYGAAPRQGYGLVGPARLVPYGEARLDLRVDD